MGGNAFASLGLATPRMKPETYFEVKRRHHDILARVYAHVVTPPEAPGKTTYGDVDFLVASPLPTTTTTATTAADRVKAAFGAEHTIPNASVRSYAVPMPAELLHSVDTGESGKVYAQIDVHECASVTSAEWMAFKHGYGDFWSILGRIARAKGLVADERGLKLVIAEIEGKNKEAAKVELTRDVGETLRFFGLDEAVYAAGFGDLEAVFGYITSSRFYEQRYFRRRWARGKDLKKVKKREMLRLFLEYVGVEAGVEGDEDGGDGEEEKEDNEEEEEEERVTREQVLEEALERFGKRAEYEDRLQSWRRAERTDAVVRAVVGAAVRSGRVSKRAAKVEASEVRRRLAAGEMAEVFEVPADDLARLIDGLVIDSCSSNIVTTD
ncbi:hypothetical protein DRE_03995 [Drechslerella stenobrocha 248]|uniref:Uncharacterized protein n=1 Tax=Drechslerella stenobrocha 248 TaxID=1043628 RepID=W7ICC7_9PEZI|nr:hypothetical protein DRE_03995 [Drechslerella stenobrocha 248]